MREYTTVMMRIYSEMPSNKLWREVARFLEQWGVHLCDWQLMVFDDEDVELHQATWEQVINCHLQHKREDFFHVLLSWPGSDWECCLGCSRDDKKYWKISLKFHECLVLQLGYPFCDTVMQMVKYAFQKFDGIFVVAGCEHYVYLEYEKLKKGILQDIPTIQSSSWNPIWFYILHQNIYEASESYLTKLPIKYIEELPNGGKFLFINYPYKFEEFEFMKSKYD